MAKSATNTPTQPATGVTTVTLTQQSLNLVRQIVAATGWAKTVSHIFLGGKLLEETLPNLEPIDWIKSDVEIRAMNKVQRAAYTKRDQDWAHKEVSFNLSAKEIEVIKAAFEHVAGTGALAPNKYLSEIITAFGIKID